MKKRVTILAMILVVVMLFGACAKPETQKGEEPKQETEQTKEVTYPVTVTDQVGREVTIKEEPEKIVSGYYISTSMLIALDEEDKLVGVEAKADTRAIYKLAAPELIELPSVGTAKAFDLETCASLEPDLVILPAKLKDTVPALEELGMTVLCVKPEDQTLLEDAISLLATATDSLEEADELLDFTDEKLAELDKCLKGAKVPSVYLGGNSAFLSTAGENMYQNSMIVNAGGANVAKEIGDTYWAEIDYEQLLTWNPEYVILAADATYGVDSILGDSNLAECSAIVNKNVYQLPSDIEAWDSPLPGSVLGSLWVASVIHSDAYSTEMYQEAVVDFYETFYDFTPEFQ